MRIADGLTRARAVIAVRIEAKLLSMDAYVKAKSISVYLSMPQGEVMTRNIVKDALANGKDVYVPFIDQRPEVNLKGREKGSRKRMDMLALRSREDLKQCESRRDKWGIPSLSPESVSSRIAILNAQYERIGNREASEATLDMIIMPGLAFDRQCRRLGHGRGFYDTFLEAYHMGKVACSNGKRPMPYIGKLCIKSSRAVYGLTITQSE